MADETTTPIPPPPGDNTAAAMADLVKNLQAGMQQLQQKMQQDSKDIIAKCNLVMPLGGDFRQYNEIGYIMQYITTDKELRRGVVDFVKAEVDKRKRESAAASGAATPAKTG